MDDTLASSSECANWERSSLTVGPWAPHVPHGRMSARQTRRRPKASGGCASQKDVRGQLPGELEGPGSTYAPQQPQVMLSNHCGGVPGGEGAALMVSMWNHAAKALDTARDDRQVLIHAAPCPMSPL